MVVTSAPNIALIIPLLAVICACVLILTLTVVYLACDVRMMLRRINAILPDAHRSFREAHQMFTRLNRASQLVEGVMSTVSQAMTGVLGRLGQRGERVGNFGNGAGVDPRRHHRSR